jgi:hypothetical protein
MYPNATTYETVKLVFTNGIGIKKKKKGGVYTDETDSNSVSIVGKKFKVKLETK